MLIAIGTRPDRRPVPVPHPAPNPQSLLSTHACLYRPPPRACGSLGTRRRDHARRDRRSSFRRATSGTATISCRSTSAAWSGCSARRATIGEELRREAAARGMRRARRGRRARAWRRWCSRSRARAHGGRRRRRGGGARARFRSGFSKKSSTTIERRRFAQVRFGTAGTALSDVRETLITVRSLRSLRSSVGVQDARRARGAARRRSGRAARPAGALGGRRSRAARTSRPLVPTLAEERFDASLELEWPIEGLEPLSFVLTRLLEPLSTRLERRDRGAAVLHVDAAAWSPRDTHAPRASASCRRRCATCARCGRSRCSISSRIRRRPRSIASRS